MKYKVVTTHGEGYSVFSIVRYNILDETDWEVVTSFRSKDKADAYINYLESTE